MMITGGRMLQVLMAVGALLLGTRDLCAQSEQGSDGGPQSAATDERWTPWLGCWELVDEDLSSGVGAAPADGGRLSDQLRERLDSLQTSRSRRSNIADGLRVCVGPGESSAAVRVTTLAGTDTLQEETIVSDGTRRAIQEPECAGWRHAEWSQNGYRLFTSAELACPGQPLRRVSGMALITPAGIWVDVQAVALGGRESVSVRRYSPTVGPENASRVSRARPAASLSLDEVIEAASKAGSAPLTAVLTEVGMGFGLDRRTLGKLADAGVSSDVIDVMVAVAYPDKFLVRTEPTDGNALQPWSGGGLGTVDPYAYSYPYPAPYSYPYYYSYSPFGYSSFFNHGYSSSGFSPWGAYSPFYLGGLTTIVVVPSEGATQPNGSGRAVNGRGYTRARPGQERAAGTAGSPSAGSAASSGGASSGGSVSPRGASSGGSGGGSGRTARPR